MHNFLQSSILLSRSDILHRQHRGYYSRYGDKYHTTCYMAPTLYIIEEKCYGYDIKLYCLLIGIQPRALRTSWDNKYICFNFITFTLTSGNTNISVTSMVSMVYPSTMFIKYGIFVISWTKTKLKHHRFCPAPNRFRLVSAMMICAIWQLFCSVPHSDLH